MPSFVKIKPSQNGNIILLFTDIGKSCQVTNFFSGANMSLNAIYENKILTKISEFTESRQICMYYLCLCSSLFLVVPWVGL